MGKFYNVYNFILKKVPDKWKILKLFSKKYKASFKPQNLD